MELTDVFQIVTKTEGDNAPQLTAISLEDLIAILDTLYAPIT